MYVVQNRLIAPETMRERVEQGFAHASNMQGTPGFVSFSLLRAEGTPPGVNEGEALYVAQSTWESPEAYQAWATSDDFTRAHAGGAGGGHSPLKSSVEKFAVVIDRRQ